MKISSERYKRGIGRSFAIVLVVIVVIILAAGIYLVVVNNSAKSSASSTASVSTSPATSLIETSSSSSTGPSTTSSFSSVSAVTSPSTSSGSSGTTLSFSSSSSVATPAILSIDDYAWPSSDLNILYTESSTFYPDWLLYDVYQPLLFVNEQTEFSNGSIFYVPGLAESWNVSANGYKYTFNLEPNVTFSDGNPLNSYQVWMEMYAWYYLSGNASAWFEGYPIFNMTNVNFGPATMSLINQSGLIEPSSQAIAIMSNSSWPIYVSTNESIVFQLSLPYSQFLGLLETGFGQVFDSQWAMDHGGLGTPTSYDSFFNLNPIPGTGPYAVTSASEDAYVIFRQNPTYWGKNLSSSQIARQPLIDPGHVNEAIIYYKPDDITRYTDLSSGAVQIAAILQTDWNLVLQNSQEYSYLTLPPWSALDSALGLNTQLYPTNITAVRQAIVHALNYTQISQAAFLGETNPYFGPEYPAWADYYDPGNYSYQYNLTLAEQDLQVVNISSLPALIMNIVSDYPLASNLAQTVQSDLSQIGLKVQISIQDSSVFTTPYGSYSYELSNTAQIGNLVEYFGTWAPDRLTAADDWITFVSNQSYAGNTALYSNPVVQNAITAMLDSNNVTYIRSQLAAAETQIYNDAPYAWLGVVKLWDADGSLVWKNGVINSFYVDPTMTAWDTAPFINTVTFG
jgi:peptide/nickel transport system substrate-binding protein